MLPFLNGELFHDLIQKLPDAIIIVNEKGTIESANSKVKHVFGYTQYELIGQSIGMLLPEKIRPMHEKFIHSYFLNPIDKKMGKHRKVMGLTKSGEEFEIDITLSSLNIENNLYALASCRNISDKKTLEYELEVENYNLQMINKGLEHYNYSVSHDLKSPLAKIEGLLDLLMDEINKGKSANELQQIFEYLKESTLSMKEMISSILEDARRKKEEEENSLMIESLFNEIKKLIAIPSSFEITLSSKCSHIRGKKSELIQVFLNLLSNAIKFNDKEKGIVKVECTENKDEYLFSFNDNGPGIKDDLKDHIFELFKKGNKLGRHSHGIGLYTIKTIVESRGGRVEVQTKVGEGTTFVFNWPKEKSSIK